MVDDREEARKAALEFGIDPDLYARQIQQESGFDPNAKGPVLKSGEYALGPAQLLPGTALDMGVMRIDPIDNLRGGAKYMRYLLDKYNGDYRLALAAYNAGMGNVDKYGGIPPFKETQNYVSTIFGSAPMGTQPGNAQQGGPAVDQYAQQPQSKGILSFITDPEKRAKLGLVLSSLATTPNAGVQSMLTNKIAGFEDTRTKNKTVEFLQSRGRSDLAQAVAGGMISPKDAVAEAIKADDPLTKLQLETAQVTLQKLKAQSDMDPNVQSSAPLPDQSGVIATMRDGTVKVTTIGGEVLTGKAAVDFVRTAQENYTANQRSIYGARREGTLGADVLLGGEAARVIKEGEMAPVTAKEYFQQAETVASSVRNMDAAIQALNEGAQSGIVYDMIPNITVASAELQNAKQRLGLDVIGSVTFGALSAGEMQLAMDTAVPSGLPPAELKTWLLRKRDAQTKMLAALQDAAIHFASNGSQEDYYRMIGAQTGTGGGAGAGAGTATGSDPLGILKD
jgi:hypothetical protein